jgi:putative membrane protein
MKRTPLQYFIISIKGIAMGAADVVPGVSGGTIAFISGIYEELISTINKVNFKTLTILKKEGLKAAWISINGNFLFSLLLGILLSILTLSKLVKWLLENEPILIWAFFFGLVLASILYIAKQIENWNLGAIIMLILGAGSAYYITTLPPLVNGGSSDMFLFLAGALAICAMILPGISGGFILLLLGAYKPAIDAINDRDIKTILILGFGAIVGLLTFSRLLKWLFESYRNLTLAVLTGFVAGSLNKIWPWKKVIQSEMINGKLKILEESSVSPAAFEGDNQLLMAIIFAAIGFVVILILEKSAGKKATV